MHNAWGFSTKQNQHFSVLFLVEETFIYFAAMFLITIKTCDLGCFYYTNINEKNASTVTRCERRVNKVQMSGSAKKDATRWRLGWVAARISSQQRRRARPEAGPSRAPSPHTAQNWFGSLRRLQLASLSFKPPSFTNLIGQPDGFPQQIWSLNPADSRLIRCQTTHCCLSVIG